MRLIRLLWLALISVGTLASVACDDSIDPGECVCTEEFRLFTVRIVDRRGSPVSDASLTRTLVRTGQVIEPGFLGLLDAGVYLVADDGMKDIFTDAGDTVRVTVARNGETVVADFVFAVPEPCRCHVEQRAGPSTIVIGN